MNCPDWEQRLALHAQGDLPPREAAAAEQHLRACVACHRFFESVKQSLELLHEAHAEPLAADFAALRARVLAELDRRHKPLWRWAWIPALAALLLLFFWTGRRPPVPPPQLAVIPPSVPPLSLPSPPPATAPKPVARVHRRKPSPPPAEPLLVRLVTDNPDVVIYWIAN